MLSTKKSHTRCNMMWIECAASEFRIMYKNSISSVGWCVQSDMAYKTSELARGCIRNTFSRTCNFHTTRTRNIMEILHNYYTTRIKLDHLIGAVFLLRAHSFHTMIQQSRDAEQQIYRGNHATDNDSIQCKTLFNKTFIPHKCFYVCMNIESLDFCTAFLWLWEIQQLTTEIHSIKSSLTWNCCTKLTITLDVLITDLFTIQRNKLILWITTHWK